MIDTIDKQKENLMILNDKLVNESDRDDCYGYQARREINRGYALNIMCHALVGIRQELMEIKKYLEKRGG